MLQFMIQQLNLFLTNSSMLVRKSVSGLQETVDDKINKQFIKVVSERNSFGYKVVTQQHLSIISKWYKSVFGLDIVLRSEQTQFFNTSGLLYSTLILGLTNADDCVLIAQTTPYEIQSKIISLGRKICFLKNVHHFESQQKSQLILMKQISQKIKQTKMMILSHPDFNLEYYFSLQFLARIQQICVQNNAIFICDESEADLCQIFASALKINDPNKIVVRSIGKHLNNTELQKKICIYGRPQLKLQSNKNYSKSIKLLPSDITIALIEISMGKLGKQKYHQLIGNINYNKKQIEKLFQAYGEKLQKLNRYDHQFMLLNLNSIQSLMLKKGLILMAYEKEQLKNTKQDYIKIDLSMDRIYFKKRIQKMTNRIAHSKL